MPEPNAVQWQLQTEAAVLRGGPLEGRVLFHEHGADFWLNTWHQRPITHRLPVLHIGFAEQQQKPLALSESYIRDNDLVATFEKTGPDRVAPQFYWRAAFNQRMAATRLELIISVQSDLLDSQPQSVVSSSAPAGRWFICDDLQSACWNECSSNSKQERVRSDSAEHVCLFRDEELGLSYVEMVHPTDFVSLHVEMAIANRCKFIKSTLFPERLEKGVIRRGRICGWFLPTENDLQTAVELALQFVNEPLPLTT